VTGIGGGAPTDADYVTVSNDGDLSDERVLSASDGLSLSDGGAGGTVTVDAATLQDPSYVTANSETGLDSERTLSTGTGLGLTDNGAGNSLTVDADTLRGEPFVTTAAASSLSGETVAGVLSDVYGSPVEVGGSGTDLRLATGQAIEDGSGTKRFGVGSNGSLVRDENGDAALFAGSAGYDLSARSGTPLRVRDREGAFTGVQYDPDSSAGVLRTPNAAIQVEDTAGGTPTQDSLFLEYFPSTPRGRVITRAADGSLQTTSLEGSPVEITSFNGLIDMSSQGADLRLANGQGIEDTNDNLRFDIQGGGTFMRDETGSLAFEGRGGTANKIFARSGQPIKFNDEMGGFDAIKYFPSSSAPGTLELTNAVLDFQAGQASTTADSMTANPESDTEDGFIEVDINGTRFQIPAYSP